MKDFQTQFLQAVHSGHFNRLFDKLLPAGSLDGMGVFRTYHMDYSTRLSHALQSSYPAIAMHLQANFSLLCQEYILDHPSQYPDLGQLGQGLADFLRGHALERKYPFLPDLADLEWCIECFFHVSTPVSPVFDFTMANEDFLRLHFDFVTHRIIPSDQGLYRRWKYAAQRDTVDEKADDAGVLVAKTPLGTQVLPLNTSRLLLMQALSTGESLGEALDLLLQHLEDDGLIPQAVADIQALFLQLRQQGFLAAVKKPA